MVICVPQRSSRHLYAIGKNTVPRAVAYIVLLGFAILSLFASSAANAAGNSCAAYVGKTVDAVDFATAVSPFLKIAPKGEFETSDQFNARLVRELADTSPTLIIKKVPEDRKFLQYNADAGTLNIQTFAFRNQEMSYWDAFNEAGYEELEDSNPAGIVSNVAVTITREDKPLGTYTGRNAYGATRTITKFNSAIGSIFERESGLPTEGLFPQAEKAPYIVGKLKLSPSEAKRIKNSLTLGFTVVPRAPYIVQSTRHAKQPTLDFPFDVTEIYTILMADITCGLVLDGNTVLAAYPTR